jgi:hypothetical protein
MPASAKRAAHLVAFLDNFVLFRLPEEPEQ